MCSNNVDTEYKNPYRELEENIDLLINRFTITTNEKKTIQRNLIDAFRNIKDMGEKISIFGPNNIEYQESTWVIIPGRGVHYEIKLDLDKNSIALRVFKPNYTIEPINKKKEE